MFDPVHAQPRGKFEALLETLDEEGAASSGKGATTGADRLWPRASGAPPAQIYVQGGQLEQLYEIERLFAEAQHGAESREPPPAPQKPVEQRSPSILLELIARASGRLNLDELRSLRRQCALALHPDRVAPEQRDRAQQLMAEANAAIDRAMAQLAQSRRPPQAPPGAQNRRA